MTLTLWPSEDETIEGAGRALREGRTTCVGLVERCLAAIEEWEPKVKAWVVVAKESALTHARGLDKLLAAGTDLGPLHGIPIGVKDMIDVRGLPTKAGAQRWSKGPAEADAPLVSSLQLNGAIVLGKTVTTPYAFIDPPPTRNPWNLDRTPGGSSSGSAAAVATGMCLAAIGTQTVGSLIRPATYCGVAAWKPARSGGPVKIEGTLSSGTPGVMPLSNELDTLGFIARSIKDLASIQLAQMVPRQWEDMSGIDSPEAPRVGLLGGLFESRAEPTMRDALSKAVATWVAAGAEFIPVQLPPEAEETWWPAARRLLAVGAADVHRLRFRDDPDDYPPRIAELIREGSETLAVDHVEALRLRTRVQLHRIPSIKELQALIMPATTGPAPSLDTTGDATFNAPWNYLNIPTLSMPIGLSPDGLPLGAQIVGLSQGNADLFQIAIWFERVLRSNALTQRA
jgi:Asp-tRNA(Asn)/Glu-tRNA(Gln) amidotransferase A subunit family amidase